MQLICWIKCMLLNYVPLLATYLEAWLLNKSMQHNALKF